MKRILDQIELFLLCFMVFAIPVHIKVTSVSIGLLMIIAILKKENYSEFLKLLKNPKFIILVLPYFFFLTGLLNSKHVSDGIIQVEIVTSLLLFPFIFTAYKSNSLKYRAELIQSFLILGVIMSYFVCMSVAIPAYLNTGDFNVFFYQVFSSVIKGPHHLSYYVIFAIVILISSLINKTPLFYSKLKLTWLKFSLIFILSIFLFQLSSKATILIYFAIAGFVFVYSVRKKIVPYKVAIPAIVAVVILSAVGLSTHKVHVRFKNLFNAVENREVVDPKSQESTAMRMAAFKAGTNIIRENFWFGTGTGDIAYAMSDFYKENNYQGAYIHHISPHNQFVRTFAMHGVFAFISLLSVFGLMIYIAFKEKHFLMMFWTFIMIVLFCVEDMFGIQDGIIFFCFYTCYFVLNPKETNIRLQPVKEVLSGKTDESA
ncbi:MAG: O-antigen ligase family protein [Bacteroidales bacterium]|nr:O-antigen ligase family protein [Bacteroidales bacterium]